MDSADRDARRRWGLALLAAATGSPGAGEAWLGPRARARHHVEFWALRFTECAVRTGLLAAQTALAAAWTTTTSKLALAYFCVALPFSALQLNVDACAAMQAMHEAVVVRDEFGRVDADADGVVSLEELVRLAGDLERRSDAIVLRAPEAADVEERAAALCPFACTAAPCTTTTSSPDPKADTAKSDDAFSLDDTYALVWPRRSVMLLSFVADALAFWSSMLAFGGSLMSFKQQYDASHALAAVQGVFSALQVWGFLFGAAHSHVARYAFTAKPRRALSFWILAWSLPTLGVLLAAMPAVVYYPLQWTYVASIPPQLAPGFYAGIVCTAIVFAAFGVHVLVVSATASWGNTRMKPAHVSLSRRAVPSSSVTAGKGTTTTPHNHNADPEAPAAPEPEAEPARDAQFQLTTM